MEQVKRKPRKPLSGGDFGYTIPQAGAMVGLSPLRSYEAAKQGFIPTVELGGRRKIVPKRAWNLKLGIEE
jgi:hypothetical protein